MKVQLGTTTGTWRLLFVAIIVIVSTRLPVCAQSVDGQKGFYVYIDHPDLPQFDSVNTKALSRGFIDGAALMFHWNQIEPQAGTFVWSNVDQWIEKTVSLHKKLSLGVIAGLFAPDWLYAPPVGVPANVFDYNRSSKSSICIVMKQPSFWSAAYLREYALMLTAFADHIHRLKISGQPYGAAWRSLQVVKLSGINNTTEELRIDATKPDSGPCHQSDAAIIWARAGFTPRKAIMAFLAISAATHNAFPGKLLSLAVIHNGALP